MKHFFSFSVSTDYRFLWRTLHFDHDVFTLCLSVFFVRSATLPGNHSCWHRKCRQCDCLKWWWYRRLRIWLKGQCNFHLSTDFERPIHLSLKYWCRGVISISDQSYIFSVRVLIWMLNSYESAACYMAALQVSKCHGCFLQWYWIQLKYACSSITQFTLFPSHCHLNSFKWCHKIFFTIKAQ